MRRPISSPTACVIAMLAAVMALLVAASAATAATAAGSAGGPQWAVSVVAAPEDFSASIDQVEDVTVKATGGTFELALGEGTGATQPISCGASAAVVQKALDLLASVKEELEVDGGDGEVTVTGSPECDETNTVPYVVTFTEGLGGEELPALEAKGATLAGATPSAAVSVVTEGAPLGGDQYVVTATNVGGAPSGGPVEIEDTLPAGVSPRSIAYPVASSGTGRAGESFQGGALECPAAPFSSATIACAYGKPVAPGDTLTVVLRVSVGAGPFTAPLLDAATVSEGGVVRARGEASTSVNAAPARFGLASFAMHVSTAQAGAHPNLTTSFTLDRADAYKSAGNVKNVQLSLPAGLIGNPRAVPVCNVYTLKTSGCPESTAVGVATVHAPGCPHHDAGDRCMETYAALVYNIRPYPGEPAAFAFRFINQYIVRLDTSLARDAAGEYAVHVSASDISGAEDALDASVTLWGAPADYNGAGPDEAEGSFGGAGEEAKTAKPFLTNASQCGEPLEASVEAGSYQEPERLVSDASLLIPSSIEGAGGRLSGCELLAPLFTPSLEVAPTSTQAGAPTGLEVHLKVPQREAPETLASPDLDDAVVALPQGMVASPAFANGLEACSNAQFAESSSEPAACPSGSEIGEVEIQTPLLATPLKGEVFLGEPECSPCTPQQAEAGGMVRLFLQASYENGSYVRIKLSGRTKIDQQTDQLTTTFDGNPQDPFEELRLTLYGGSDAPLANPRTCGTVSSSAALTPWNGGSPVASSSAFQVQGCSAQQFAPSFAAGMTGSGYAGSYSPFSVTFSRIDRDEDFSGVTVQTPPGLLGMVSHVSQCGEAEANAGTCPVSSEIGSARAAVGPGPDPYWIAGGKVFLTGPYHGDPFGLSIVVPAKAGPFTLAGQTGTGAEGDGSVVVRTSIAVNPTTAALTVTSNSLPQELDGIPLQLRTVAIEVDRPEFMFNATNCETQRISAVVTGVEGATAPVSSPYQASDCASLAFKPSFTASTPGKVSRRGGAALKVLVVPPDEGASSSGSGEANLHEVKVTLPKLLPARLSTLNKACLAKTFEENPADCPSESNVGMAIAHTPVLNSPLMGPAYFVSHGGAAFPNLDVVLQGEGVTIELVGETHISKAGITTSTFATIPDAPITSFELSLPEGPYSALAAPAAGGSLCGHRLEMATRMVAQNGAVEEQETKIAVTGCAPALYVESKKVSGKTARLKVEVPAAGKIKASGKGLSSQSKKPGKEKIVSLAVKLTKAQSAKLSKGKQVKAKIKLAFTPKSGKKLTKTVTVTFKPAEKTGGKKTGKAKKKK